MSEKKKMKNRIKIKNLRAQRKYLDICREIAD